MKIIRLLFLILLVLFITFCNLNEDGNEKDLNIPEDRDDGWTVASLDSVGMDKTYINSLISDRNNGGFNLIHSIIIAKNGKLVSESYFSGKTYGGIQTDFKWNTQHYAASTTKSFTSAIIGILMFKGYLNNVDQKLNSFFPEYPDIDWAGDKGKINLHHVLTMSAGLDWDEWSYPFTDSRNSLGQLNSSDNQIRFVLTLPSIAEPGTKFAYSSGLSIILGAIVKNTTGEYIDDFARQYLFKDLKINNVYWYRFPNDIVHTGGGLFMIPRDMAKLGQLYLNGGTWNGKQILSKEWIDMSTKSHIAPFQNGSTRYGYQWWVEYFSYNGNSTRTYCAEGHGGQYIIVIPDLDMVIVTTGGYYDSNPMSDLKRMIEDYIFKSIR